MSKISNKNITIISLLIVFCFVSGCGGGDDQSSHGLSNGVTISGFNSAGFYQSSFGPASVETEAIVASYGRFVDVLFERFGEPRHLQGINTNNTNLIYTPYNLYETFNQMKEGAEGQMLDRLSELTFTTLDQDHASSSWNAISQDIIQRNPFAPIQRVNRFWGQQRYRFSTRFFEDISKYYDTQISGLDFFGNASAAVDAITVNHTNFSINRILDDEILPDDGEDVQTRIVTENGTALTVDWRSLAGDITEQEGTFAPYGSQTRKQSRMLLYTGPMSKRQSEKFETVSLPLDSGGLELVMITPNTAGDAQELIDNLSVDWLKREVDSSVATDGTIAIPMLSIQKSFALEELFGQIISEGTSIPNEGFSRINNVGFLEITNTWHSSTFELNEQGASSEALTIAIYDATEGEPPELFTHGLITTIVSVSFDCYFHPPSSKPFLFFIYDKVLGIPLIFGQVMNVAGDSVPFDGLLLPQSPDECTPLK